MTFYVFIGPTLRPQEVLAAIPDAICLPPVAQGDVYRVARRQPRAIGIIDGYFTGAPSVWHKEILWALAQGIAVFGSASMGALRAAELHAFGMTGVGKIFEAYRDGTLEDDDEVAVVHGPPETGFIAACEPMVNIRATLERAEHAAVISAAARVQLETAAKSLVFGHRTWPNVFKAVADQDVTTAQLPAFQEWLPQGAVDQKRDDAMAMLAAMQAAAGCGARAVSEFRFEQTYFWDDLVERIEDDAQAMERQTSVPAGILDEVRLLGPDAYRSVMKNALLRLLAEREAQRRGFTPSPEARTTAMSRHREDLGLYRRSQLDDWLTQNGLDEASCDRLMEQEALLGQFVEASVSVLVPYLLDELRLSGKFHQLVTRARDKADRIDGDPATATAFPSTAQLRVWYFEDRLGVAMPDDVHSVAAALGFDSIEQFDLTLRREWMYAQVIHRGLNGPDKNIKGSENPSG